MQCFAKLKQFTLKNCLGTLKQKDMKPQKLKSDVKPDQMEFGTLPMKDLSLLPKRNRLNWNQNNQSEVVIRKNTRLVIHCLVLKAEKLTSPYF